MINIHHYFVIASTIVFGIFSFSSFISIFLILPISNLFSISKSPTNLEILYPIVSIFNFSMSFISVSNFSISLTVFLVIFLNLNFSLILFSLSQNVFFIAPKFNFFSNSSNSFIFIICIFFSSFFCYFFYCLYF